MGGRGSRNQGSEKSGQGLVVDTTSRQSNPGTNKSIDQDTPGQKQSLEGRPNLDGAAIDGPGSNVS